MPPVYKSSKHLKCTYNKLASFKAYARKFIIVQTFSICSGKDLNVPTCPLFLSNCALAKFVNLTFHN